MLGSGIWRLHKDSSAKYACKYLRDLLYMYPIHADGSQKRGISYVDNGSGACMDFVNKSRAMGGLDLSECLLPALTLDLARNPIVTINWCKNAAHSQEEPK